MPLGDDYANPYWLKLPVSTSHNAYTMVLVCAKYTWNILMYSCPNYWHLVSHCGKNMVEYCIYVAFSSDAS